MCRQPGSIVFAIIAILCLASLHTAYGNETPISIIFDSDVDHDCDDIGALYILHGAVERGEAKLLATMGCTLRSRLPLAWMRSIRGSDDLKFPLEH